MWCWQDSKARVRNPHRNPQGNEATVERARLRGPVIPNRLLRRLPRPWRRVLDWVLTIAVAVALVLVFEAEVAKPYRVPSSSMEPTLHCAKPGDECLGSFDDRVIANRLAYRFSSPKRGQIVVFKAPAAASRCGDTSAGTTFVKRLIG